MAANDKPIYATDHTTHGGKYFKPGERMDNRGLPEHAIRGALEGGIASDSQAAGERARKTELERVERVNQEIATRSEQREHNRQPRQLVRLPDGSFAYAD